MRHRFGPSVGAYTDPAAAFMLLALDLVRPHGGVVALVEPVSLLTARDASGVRAAVGGVASLTDLWVLDHRPFGAAVEVCVPVAVRGGTPDPVRLRRGPRAAVVGEVGQASSSSSSSSWSPLLADLQGLPTCEVRTSGVLGDLASATADFRDQYYGLAPHVVDREVANDAAWPRLVTAGAIDPATLRWGARPTRFNKATYQHPRVDLAALPERLGAWARARLVPKVLLATQTRVPEALADPTGALLPSVPVVSVVPRRAEALDVWRRGGAHLPGAGLGRGAPPRRLWSGRAHRPPARRRGGAAAPARGPRRLGPRCRAAALGCAARGGGPGDGPRLRRGRRGARAVVAGVAAPAVTDDRAGAGWRSDPHR
ncbi:MAG: hypothetical protein U0P45_02640 [Acidimicrobiales bacterium]